MPRPVVEQKTVVAPVPVGQEQAPQLGVYAPVLGARAPSSSGFQGLAQALGVLGGGTLGALNQRAVKTQQVDTTAGAADAELGQVDPARLAHSEEYASAVHKVNVQKQYLQAEATTQEWAATHVDKTLPFGEQTKLIDGHMQSQLGGLAKDPAAAAVIAPLYAKFIHKQANDIVAGQVKAKQNEALEVAKGTVAQSLAAGGDGDYVGQVATLTPILGDRSASTKAVTQMYIDHAIDVAGQGGDWRHVFDSLPTDITLKDGTKIPGPGRSPALHDALLRGKAAAQKAYNDFVEPQHAQKQLDLMTHLDAVARSGGLITEESMKPYITKGADGQDPLLTVAQASGYIDRAARKAGQNAKERAVRTHFLVPDWQKYLNQVDPTDPKGKRVLHEGDFQTAYDQQLGMATNNFADPADTAAKAVVLTQKVGGGLVSSTLKAQLRGAANRSTAADAVKLLPAFETLQAAGQLPGYLTPDQIAFYNNIAIQAKQGQGTTQASTEALTADAARYDPAQVKAIVDDSLPAARKEMTSITTDNHPWIPFMGGVDYRDYATPAQMNQITEPLLRKALSDNGGNVEQAVASVKQTVLDSYAPVEIRGVRTLVPRADAADPQVLQDNLNIIGDKVVPDLAKAAGVTKAETDDLTWQVSTMPGQKPVLIVVSKTTGLPVDAIPPVTLDSAMKKGNTLRMEQEDKVRRAEATRAKNPLPGQGTPLYMTH